MSIKQDFTGWLAKTRLRLLGSFAQEGEDLLVHTAFNAMGIERPTYLDVGAFDPFKLSNTAYFYRLGCKGVNVEPNPAQFRKFQLHRPNDRNLNLAVSDSQSPVTLHIISSPELSSICAPDASMQSDSPAESEVGTVEVASMTIKQLVDKYCGGTFPDFLSLDAEGYDYAILQSTPFDQIRPLVICVETAIHGTCEKEERISLLLHSVGYRSYATTFHNTIFVDQAAWARYGMRTYLPSLTVRFGKWLFQ